jgi:hypothetical protein
MQLYVVSSHNTSRKRHITVRLTGYSRSVGTQCGPWIMSRLMRQEFGCGSYIFGSLRTPASKYGTNLTTSLQKLSNCLPDCVASHPKDTATTVRT